MYDETLDNFIEDICGEEEVLFKDIVRQSHLKTMQPRMASGYDQGKILSLLSGIIQPQNILELGTFTGYSALSLAKGLKSNGKLITIEKNDEIEYIARDMFDKSPYKDQIDILIGDAVQIIPTLDTIFDLIFIDADKRQYPQYFALLEDKVTKGGLIIIDNILWNGKVLEKPDPKDKYLEGVNSMNQMVKESTKFEKVILPLRDGLMVLRRL